MTRIPWRLRASWQAWQNRSAYVFRRVARRKNGRLPRISFNCGFHGTTGGSIAISTIANLLATQFNVVFTTFPSSPFNRRLSREVALTNNALADADVYICDVSIAPKTFDEILRKQKVVIVSCHGMPHIGHGLTESRVRQVLANADIVQFVSQAQATAFDLPTDRYVVIPNCTREFQRSLNRTRNVGIVCNTSIKSKNSQQALAAAVNSSADRIHIWGAHDHSWGNERVVCHEWTSNQSNIYQSFDVHVSMSASETFGMTVIEAMSAGLPSVLSDIPAFRQFEKLPGMMICDSGDLETASKSLNTLLAAPDDMSAQIRECWRRHFSPPAVLQRWTEFLDTVTA